MKRFFLLIILCCYLGCGKKKPTEDVDSWHRISQHLSYKKENGILMIKSGVFQYRFTEKELPLKKTIVLNSSLLGYLVALNLEETISGVSSPEYIYSEVLRKRISEGKIACVGSDEKYDVEKIISLKPHVVFTNYIPIFQNAYDVMRKNGIKIIFLNEYTEETPLDKTAYLKLFGMLFGKEEHSNKVYLEIENNYNSLQRMAIKSPRGGKVICNEMYGNQWFMPGGKTFVATYLKDANSNYIFSKNQDTKAIPMSFEEVVSRSKEATFWVNLDAYSSKKELLTFHPHYKMLDVFSQGKIYSVTAKTKGKANDYFEMGVVRADWVLRDYIKIIHPELLPKHHLTYMKEIK